MKITLEIYFIDFKSWAFRLRFMQLTSHTFPLFFHCKAKCPKKYSIVIISNKSGIIIALRYSFYVVCYFATSMQPFTLAAQYY